MSDVAGPVLERDGHVEVRGVSAPDVSEALSLLNELRGLQADRVAATRETLVRALMVLDGPAVPAASIAQAQRLASSRDALLATPVWTHEELAKMRGESSSSTRAWVTRHRSAHRLFTVTNKGKALIPAFQLTEEGTPRQELQPALESLSAAGVTGWTLWTWLTTRSSLLSGEVPEQLAARDPDRVHRAARRFAARSAQT